MAVLEPFDVVDDGCGPGLDAAVVAIDRSILSDFGVGEPVGFLLGGEQFDVIAQSALIAFEGQDVIGFLVDHLLRDVALAPHSVDGDDGSLDRHHVEQFRDRGDLVGLFRHLDLPQHQALAGSQG